MQHLIGLDVGTTGCKAVVFDPRGEIRGQGFQEYGILGGEPGMAEQDAEEVWRLTCLALREALQQARGAGVPSSELRALSLSVQGDAIIPVGRRLRPVQHAVLGMDYRSQPQAERCRELFGDRELFQRTGMRPHPINALIKMLWLREKRPEAYKAAWKITTYEEFILGRLGAEPVIDHTMASRSMAFDLHRREWAVDLLERLSIDPALLCRVVPSGTPAGKVSEEAAAESGLAPGTVLVTGGHDQCCAALGAGVIDQGLGVVSTGTAEVLSTAFRRPALGEQMFSGYYPCYLHARPGLYFTFALNHVGGLLLRWFRDTFALPEVEEARRRNRDPYEVMLEKLPPGPGRVMVLPHFNGSGTPWCDMASRGAIVGLDLATTRHDLTRAILESQSYELLINLQTLEQAGASIQELRAVGGGARSPAWLQIKADILGRPISTLRVREAACLGAAVLAGAATGVFSSIDSGVAAAVCQGESYRPEEGRSTAYRERFAVYREIYPALSPIHHRLQ